MKKITLALLFVIVLMSHFTVSAKAESTCQRTSVMQKCQPVTVETVKVKTHHNNSAPVVQPDIMQDLTQCVVSNLGELLCADVCGGRSVPGTICSYE